MERQDLTYKHIYIYIYQYLQKDSQKKCRYTKNNTQLSYWLYAFVKPRHRPWGQQPNDPSAVGPAFGHGRGHVIVLLKEWCFVFRIGESIKKWINLILNISTVWLAPLLSSRWTPVPYLPWPTTWPYSTCCTKNTLEWTVYDYRNLTRLSHGLLWQS